MPCEARGPAEEVAQFVVGQVQGGGDGQQAFQWLPHGLGAADGEDHVGLGARSERVVGAGEQLVGVQGERGVGEAVGAGDQAGAGRLRGRVGAGVASLSSTRRDILTPESR